MSHHDAAWLKRERVLLQCLRWFAEEGSDFPELLARAELARHPLQDTRAAALGVFITDEDGNVIEVDEDEMEAPDAKRRRRQTDTVDVLYRELFPGQHDQPQSAWSTIPTLDAKEHILELVLDVADVYQPMTRLFSLLAMQWVSKGEGGMARHVLQRFYKPHPPMVPMSFASIARLIDEDASPALFAWSLWLYTGQTTPAFILSQDEISTILYRTVKGNRAGYLDVLLLGLPRRADSGASRQLYSHIFAVLMPLALFKARFVGWDACAPLQWAIKHEERLRTALSVSNKHRYWVVGEGDAAVYVTDWIIERYEDGDHWNVSWYLHPRNMDESHLRLLDSSETAEHGIPLNGLQWLEKMGIVQKTLTRLHTTKFWSVVLLDTVEKATYLTSIIHPYSDTVSDYLRHDFWRVRGIDLTTRIVIVGIFTHAWLNILNEFETIFGAFVDGALSVSACDDPFAQRLLRRFHQVLEQSRVRSDVLYRALYWATYLRRAPLSNVIGLCTLIRGLIPFEANQDILYGFLTGVHGTSALPAETDAAVARFVRELHRDHLYSTWAHLLDGLQRAVFRDANGSVTLLLPQTTEAVKEIVDAVGSVAYHV